MQAIIRLLCRASHEVKPSLYPCALLDEHRLAKSAERLERRDGRVFEPSFQSVTRYLPFCAANPVGPHVAGARQSSWRAAASWGAALVLGVLRNDGPLLAARMGTAMWQSASANPAVTSQRISFRPRAQHGLAIAGWSCAAFLALVLSGELVAGNGRSKPSASLGPAWFDSLHRLGLLGIAHRAMLHRADGAERSGRCAPATWWLGAALGTQLLIETMRLCIVIPTAACAAMIGATFGIAVETVLRLQGAIERAAYRASHGGRSGETVSMAQAESAVRAALFRDHLTELDDESIAAPLIGNLWRAIHRGGIEVGDNVWAELGRSALEALQPVGTAPNPLQSHSLSPRAHATVLHGTLSLGPLWRPPSFAAGRRLSPCPSLRRKSLPLGGDPNSKTRLVRTRTAVAILYEFGGPIDVEAALGALQSFCTAEQEDPQSPLNSQPSDVSSFSAHATWRRVHIALYGRGNASFLPILDARNTWSDGKDGVFFVRDICARAFAATQNLKNDSDEPMQTSRARGQAFVRAVASCIEEGESPICAQGQIQRMLGALQGYIPGVVIDDTHLSVPAFVALEYYGLVHRLGHDPAHSELVAGLDAVWAAGQSHFRRGGQRRALGEQLRDLASYNHDCLWQAPTVAL